MNNIKTTAQLNDALKDGLKVGATPKFYGDSWRYTMNIVDMKGNKWVEDTDLIEDLAVKCRERGLLKFGC